MFPNDCCCSSRRILVIALGDDGDDGHEVVPKVNAYAEQFRCHLCPEKLLLSHGDLEKHEASKAHLNRLHRQQQQEEGGKEPGPGDAGMSTGHLRYRIAGVFSCFM